MTITALTPVVPSLSNEHLATFETGEPGVTGEVRLYREHLRAIQNAGYNMAGKHIAINVRLKWYGNGNLRIDGAYDAENTFVPVATAARVGENISRRERARRARAQMTGSPFTTVYTAGTDEPAHASHGGRRGKRLS